MSILNEKKMMWFLNAISMTDSLCLTTYLFVYFFGLYLLFNYSAIAWVDLILDDAYYYIGIARNLVDHGVSQFSSPLKTNGYQPLWLSLLTVSASLFGTSDTALVTQCYSLSFAFLMIFVYLSRRRYGMAFPALLTILSYSFIVLNGMESALLPALILMFFSAKTWTQKGVMASLLFLGRLDALSVVIANDLYIGLTQRKWELLHYTILLPIVLFYLLFNYFFYGVPVPVSGLQKAIGNFPFENLQVGLGYLSNYKTIIRLFGGIVLVNVLASRPYFSLRFCREWSVLTFSTVLCATYYSSRSGWIVWPWYYWPIFTLIFYGLLESVLLIKLLLPSPINVRNGLAISILLLNILYTSKIGLNNIVDRWNMVKEATSGAYSSSYSRQNLKLAEYVRLNFPHQVYFAMGDRAGSFGFFLGNEYRFFHTEGLVASYEYYQAMHNDQGLVFADGQGIDYWIAERERFLELGDVIGVIEPIQGRSAHQGPYLLCFSRNAIILDQSYIPSKYQATNEYEYRYVFDNKGRVTCPDSMYKAFSELKQRYSGIRDFSLPIETRFSKMPGSWMRLQRVRLEKV